MRETVVLIPSTFTGECRDRKIRTYKIGSLARILTNFRVDKVIVYYDEDPKFDSHGLGRYIVKVMKYLITPPYIRKFLFPKEKDLEFVGVCPPLEIKIHQPEKNNLKYKIYYVKEKGKSKTVITDGKRNIVVNKAINKKTVIFNLEKNCIIDENYIKNKIYLGYKVIYYNKKLDTLLKRLKKLGYFIIGTSKYGKDIRTIKNLRKKIDKKGIVIVFGSPFRGIREILGEKYYKYFDIVINTIPNQELETTRVEEAIACTLSIFRYLNLI